MNQSFPASRPARFARLPQLLSVLLLASGLLLAVRVPLAGAPPPRAPLLGEPGVIKTHDPQLQQLERDIVARNGHDFTITLDQQALDTEMDYQLNDRLRGQLPVHDAWLQPEDGALGAGGVVDLGFASLQAELVLGITTSGCAPVVEVQQIVIGGADTPGWLKARAEALVRQQIAEELGRSLGFCLESVTLKAGQIVLTGIVARN